VLVLSDEIYSRICYGVEPSSITQFDGMLEKTIILDGFSKTYSMTGWRLGYGVMPLVARRCRSTS
jgi:aspartate/methionine/tyrosine aminotransferase